MAVVVISEDVLAGQSVQVSPPFGLALFLVRPSDKGQPSAMLFFHEENFFVIITAQSPDVSIVVARIAGQEF